MYSAFTCSPKYKIQFALKWALCQRISIVNYKHCYNQEDLIANNGLAYRWEFAMQEEMKL